MPILMIIFFMCFVLPYWILKEGMGMFKQTFGGRELWWQLPVYGIIALSLLVLVLLIYGYEF